MTMRATVDKSGCIGCGLCVSTCPEVIAMDNDQKAEAMLNPVPANLESETRQAADTCPVSVIEIIG